MCFSAAASFSVAATTGLVGALAVMKVTRWQEIPLALGPFIFAAQQAIEGALWLLLPGDGASPLIANLTGTFAFVAVVMWPLWSPLAAGLVEPDRIRRLAIGALFMLAIPVAIWNFDDLSTHPYSVCILQKSLSYTNGLTYSPLAVAAYIACTTLPLLVSSTLALRVLGLIVVAGLAVSSALYFTTSFSVWCFFAAAGSVTIYVHFISEHARAIAARAASRVDTPAGA